MTPRPSREDIAGSLKPVDAWWTVLVIDPLVVRALPWVLRRRRLTPNALTGLAVGFGVLSGACFLLGLPQLGALLFEVRFFFDCLDGKVARLRRLGSSLGGYLDRVADLVVATWVLGALCVWLAGQHALPSRVCLLPVVLLMLSRFANGELRATRAMTGAAGPNAVRAATGLTEGPARHRLNRLPGGVEAMTVMLFLAPLTGSPRIMAVVVWLVAGLSFLPRFALNTARTIRLLTRYDRAGRGDATGG